LPVVFVIAHRRVHRLARFKPCTVIGKLIETALLITQVGSERNRGIGVRIVFYTEIGPMILVSSIAFLVLDTQLVAAVAHQVLAVKQTEYGAVRTVEGIVPV